ncbi:protein mono-ADP-ribosyltransferase PARP14-like isoform X2 [Melanotaenia boesemani]|uniref:protein mono-ADP-ribosyltransferase PARP14-like isoform X2 n=1 Tax=Melanotaenia boesemani TaxID=1250792 RepID=UPI001C05CE3A|nr:protein mono-ADP-ribosyltransferase PARP14-like isoform X2 [Melanotaenia boesemani]
MADCECPPVTVEGDWSPAQNKTLKNKLQLYFQSKKRSSGGDCRVEVADGAPRAAVYFRSDDVRERVLARTNHEIILEKEAVKLRLSSGLLSGPSQSPTDSDQVSDSSTDSRTPKSEVEPADGASAASQKVSGSALTSAVVLENVTHSMSRDLLMMLVENISGLDENAFSLEIIWEANKAVVIFSSPADVEKFVSVSQTNSKMQKHRLTARPLEAAKSVRMESLPPTVVKDMLEMWFEKNWAPPDDVIMIPEEQAAIVSFSDPTVVAKICTKEDHMMRSIAVKLYPYYESLGTALYGTERPAWKMPDSFRESVHPVIWKFLLMKKQLKSINDQMRPHFCSVDLDDPEVTLSPLPSFLKQSGLTAADVENWMRNTQKAFREFMSQYTAFECAVSTEAWKSAEKDIHSVVKEDAVLVFDASRSLLTVAGCADDIKQIRAPVENIVLRAMSVFERQARSITEGMVLSSAWLYILKQEGLQKAALDISSELNLSYDDRTQKLAITGLPEEVYKTKAWILERNVNMSKKQLNIPPGLLQYLSSVDPMDMSEKLFTSQGISAIYCYDTKGIFLLGSSDRILADAESKMKADLHVQTLDVEDQEVVKLHGWVDLNQKLLDTYNSSNRKTVAIQIHPERRDKVTVAGFVNPVKEVFSSLKEFIRKYSHVQETVQLGSCAIVQFIEKKQSQVWIKTMKNNKVSVHFDPERPRIVISGARLHVHELKSCFQELAAALFADTLTVDKPGAKKHFQSQGSMFLSPIMSEFSCVVVLQSEIQDENEEDTYEEETSLCYCKVQTSSKVLVSVSRADICSFRVDAVVNAANEELQHIGGLALALLKAAGPELQKISTDYVTKNGKLRPGDAIVTGACNLPCKYIVHAVGPRFSDNDKKTSVSRLKMAVKESLRQAEMVSCSTIALPAISSGVFGFPVQLCADTIAEAVREYCDSPQGLGTLTEIHLVDNNVDTARVLATAVNTAFIDLGPTMTVPQQASRRGATASGRYQRGRGRGRGHRFGDKGARGGHGGRGAGNHQVTRQDQSTRGPTRHQEHRGLGRMEQTTPDGLKIALCKGNIQDQNTDVIVNTIADNMNLDQGAVSKAIVEAAGESLQVAVQTEAGVAALDYGEVVITDGYRLRCRKVFHAVCPSWDNGAGQAEKEFLSIITFCLEEAEKQKMSSLSFPAIGTGNLGFPRDLVSRILLKEIHLFSRRTRPRHLREVVVVVHPSDSLTVDCFTREFTGQTSSVNVHHAALDSHHAAAQQPARRSLPSSASASSSFSLVSSPILGVYRMQMGQLILEVSSGDITKETCDVIVNSSNQSFNLQAGVSKAILDSAGLTVQQECSMIVNSPGYLPRAMIMTSAGQLPCQNIIHVVGRNEPAKIKELVYAVLKTCEENKFTSVAFPALGTGQGGASPSAVADAMVDAVVEFVRKKHHRFVCSVKILIFQTVMITEFVNSMKKRQGEDVERSIFGKLKDSVTSFFGFGSEQPSTEDFVLEREEFEPAVFELCADNQNAVNLAKRRINELIVHEQMEKTISDKYINQLSQADLEELKTLQRKLTVRIRLDRGNKDQEPKIHLEGLTRDVYTAADAVSSIIRKVERTENEKSKAILVSGLVEWQFQSQRGAMVPFDIYINLKLEEALETKQSVKIKINGDMYTADPKLRTAVSTKGSKQVELLRKDLKVDSSLPAHWDDMKGDIVKLFPLTVGSTEYTAVQTELTKAGLAPNIISIERVQNVTLWQSYQLLKKQLEKKNNHTNNEKLLFHGTGADSIDLINNKGFNRSYAGQHGAMYGKGSYFAVNPVYSAQGYARADAKGHKRMYQAQVLVGDYTQGNSGMITPPSKSGNAADLYDSVTDNKNSPTMFVVFNDIQAYPEYLITFT